MIDVPKQIEYWCSSALEDWEVAVKLVQDGKSRHGLFFAHLALEKVLKSHICRQTQSVPPRIHNLIRLLELSAIAAEERHVEILADMNQFQIEGRYPENLLAPPSRQEAEEYMTRALETFQWLTRQL
ncbi:MAG: HEPN domain-containing protein [Planctomycetota bacterium]|jgi:HEPN domain-containing protein